MAAGIPGTADRKVRSPWPFRLAATIVFILIALGLDSLARATLMPLAYTTLIRIGIYAILAGSLNLVNGVTGQFSLGHAAFMVIGAYTGGIMSTAAAPMVARLPGWEGPAAATGIFVLGLLAGAITAAAAGLIVGLPTLRLRGDYLAIATLGFGEITRVVFAGWNAVGGSVGLSGVPSITNLFWTILVMGGSLLLLRNIQRSGPGRDFMAVREDEVAAASVGVDVVRAKVVAFIVAASFAGMAGVLLVHLNNGIEPHQAGFMNSIEIVVMVVLGGMGSLTGSVLGAALLVLFRAIIEGWQVLEPYARYENVIYPVLLLALMLFRREGLLGYRELGIKSFTPFFTRWRRTEQL